MIGSCKIAVIAPITQYIADLMWFGMRSTSTGDQWSVFLFEWRKKKITRSRPLFSLHKKRKSNSKCNRKLKAGDLMMDQKAKRAGRRKLESNSEEVEVLFSVGRGSLFIDGDPLY